MAEHAKQLAKALSNLENDLIFVVTGAGVSANSGIPTFRGKKPDALWKTDDVELATFDFFRRDPVSQWLWYLERFEAVELAKPNPAHEALVGLESWQVGRGGRFQLVTQNIDTLHETAGSKSLIKIHGTSARLRCSRRGCTHGAPSGSVGRDEVDLAGFRQDPRPTTLPRCPDCGEPLRAHVLFFDEYYQDHDDYRFETALASAREAAAFLFVGTSFSVGITDIFLRIAAEGRVPIYSVDPTNAPPPHFPIVHLAEAAEELLPETVRLAGTEFATS